MAVKVSTLAARVALVFVLLLASGCGEERYGMPDIKLLYKTSGQRRTTLFILRRHWEDRPRAISPEANLYERALLNRAAHFGRKINGTETYRAACDFWMSCVKEHISRYEDDAHHFRD